MADDLGQNPIPARIDDSKRPPRLAQVLGFAGLLPHVWALMILLFGNPEARSLGCCQSSTKGSP